MGSASSPPGTPAVGQVFDVAAQRLATALQGGSQGGSQAAPNNYGYPQGNIPSPQPPPQQQVPYNQQQPRPMWGGNCPTQ